jgi:hypothetical protein
MDLQVGIEQVVPGFRRRQRDIATMMPRSMGFPSWGFAAATLCLSVFSRRSFRSGLAGPRQPNRQS